MPITVLIIAASRKTRDAFAGLLTAEGYPCITAAEERSARSALRTQALGCVLVDLDLPAGAGFDACRRIRGVRDIPVIALMSQPDELSEVRAFQFGADEVLRRNDPPRVLLTRIAAVLRRRGQQGDSPDSNHLLSVDAITVNRGTREVAVNGVEVSLTRTEFELLVLLMEQSDTVVRREEIVSSVWGNWPGDDHIIEVQLSRLRSKILKAGGPHIAEAVRGIGYRFASRKRPGPPHGLTAAG